ncbi:Phospholipid hydroperoxide glutathione peroxidase [Seminavis robusta]|uniref:Phospholipid hydroperoxide glutathione peroxidase n=1 Tax=Seminavis robusta TaxID=568900 RepID=A0A9N8DJ17_9STRA|nr:Phospholipid hydroperoxide glutathione peroxidase [Seminavis robusta]|eukprot:Sro87_g046030.1 Phospholipid hydroperoxide glutathione peroxidase (131) ;mRNA; r:44653-45283
MTSLYDLSDKKIDGQEVNFSSYQGSAILFFGKQEPGTAQEILEFVKQFDDKMEEKLEFFEKGDVNGDDARQVYKLLTTALPEEDGSIDIPWNFAKFLVDSSGKPIKRYSPKTAPVDIKPDIEALLKEGSS